MQQLAALAGIVGALSVGVVSPGPSFVMVARTAVSQSRGDGVCAALGMGLGGAFFASCALLGLQAVLLAVPTVYFVLKVLGGLYLCWLAIRIFRGASSPLAMQSADQRGTAARLRSFGLGLSTQLSNPKTAIVYASVFAALLPAHFSLAFALVLLAAVFSVETLWYAIVAVSLSAQRPRTLYLSAKAWIDRVAGTVLFALGFKLVLSS
jgi:threonine/homoserine/homoserine lactone efflux protein